MRQTQTELLRAVNSDVRMYINDAGFFNRLVTVGAIICALTRCHGRAHWLDVANDAGNILRLPIETMSTPCKDEPNRSTWERECSFAYADVLVKQKVCLPHETTGRGIWQFAPNVAPETPDYSKLKS